MIKTFSDLINLKIFNEFQDLFYRATGLLIRVADPEARYEKELYHPELKCDFCKIILSTKKGWQRCFKCNIDAGRKSAKIKRPLIYTCHAGLTNIVVPVIFNNSHIGNIFTGKLLLDRQNEKYFAEIKERVKGIRINLTELKRAYYEVNIRNKEKLKLAMKLLFFLSKYMIEIEERFVLEKLLYKQRETLNRLRTIGEIEFFHDILSGNKKTKELENMAKFIGFKDLPNIIIVVRINIPETKEYDELLKQTAREKVMSVIKGTITNRTLTKAIYYRNNEIVILRSIPVPRNINSAYLSLKDDANKILKEVEEKTKYTVSIGIGRIYLNIQELHKSYQDAINALLFGLVPNFKNRVIHIEDIKEQVDTFHTYPVEKENLLVSKIQLGEFNSAYSILVDILKYILDSDVEKQTNLKIRLIELLVVLTRASIRAGVSSEKMLRENTRYINDILKAQTQEEIKGYFTKILRELIDEINLISMKNKARNIERVKRYIEEHYAEKITLENASGISGLSSYYFSRLFKKETGKNFIDYLISVRIKVAKQLLAATDLTVSEIAYRSGFSDPNYFCVKFKGLEVLTPTEFRTSK